MKSFGIGQIADYYDTHPRSVSSPFGGVGTSSAVNSYLDEMLTKLHIGLKGKRVLDIGCGSGWFARYCAGLVSSYTGIDVAWTSAVMTKVVTRQVMRSAGDELPLKNGVFDYVFFIDTFEHIQDQMAAAREAYRVLAKNGKIFLSVPNYSNVCGLMKKIEESLGLYAKNSWAPFDGWAPQALERFMTPGSIRKIALACGFRKFTMIGGYRDFIDGVFPWVDHKRMRGASLMRAIFAYIERPLNHVFPWLSLHNFWLIEK